MRSTPVLILGAVLFAWTAEPEKAPDEVALTAARKIQDPVQKIAALNDILAKYPGTKIESSIRSEIFRANLKAYPADSKLILTSAEAILKATPKGLQRRSLNDIATALLRADVCLPEAVKYARKALSAYKEKDQSRSGPLQTLGVLEIKTGRVDQGRRLLTEALTYQPMSADANVALGELAEKDGDDAKALDHFLLAKLSGRMPEQAQGSLKRLYTKKHGSLDTLDATLDQMYKARFPSPVHVNRYAPAPGRPPHTVLVEFFTGAGCPPCSAADLAFDAILERYSRDEVAVVVYHQHIPQPDPMAFPATRKRLNFYQSRAVPTYVVDGGKDTGGGTRENSPKIYEKINAKIEKRLTEPATAAIDLRAFRDGGKILVKAAVEPVAGDKRDLRLHVLLVEQSLRYSGENGIRFHPMVVRAIAGPDTAEGFPLDTGKRYEREISFEIPAIAASLKTHLDDYEGQNKIRFSQKMHEIDPNRLAVVAFVQDAGSNAVLQSRFTKP